jgi:O-antigen/teichoic acid export membrane protein
VSVKHAQQEGSFPHASLDKRIAWTTTVGFIRTGCAIPIYFLLTPFVVRVLGKDYYGLWSLSGVISTLLTLSDFGFQNSLVHFTAMSLNDSTKLGKLFNTIYFLFLGLSILFLVCILIFSGVLIDSVFNVAPKYHQEGRFIMACSGIMLSLRFITVPYEAVIQGNQRVYYTQADSLCWLLFTALATFIGLSLFPCIYTIGIVNVLGTLLLLALNFTEARRRYEYVRIAPRLVDMRTIKSVLPYSAWIQVASILIALREPVLKTVLSRRYGLADLASFDIAYRLTIQCMAFVTVPLLTVLPVSSLLHDKPRVLHRFVRRYTWWVLCILVVPCILVWFLADDFIRLWLGSGFRTVSAILPWVFTAYCIAYLTEPLYKTVQGMGNSSSTAFAQGLFFGILVLSLYYCPMNWGVGVIAYSLVLASVAFACANVVNYRLLVESAAVLRVK